MTLNKGGNGFQARSHPSERRADFDLMRRISQLERLDDGGSGGGSLPPDGDPGEVLTIDSGGAPVWAPGATGIVQTVVAGTNITVNSTDPAHPIVSTTPPLVTTTWTDLPLTTNWVGQTAAHAPQYRKVGDEVQMRGTLWWKSPFPGTPIGILPVGFRPGRTEFNSTAVFMSTAGTPIASDGVIWGPRLAVTPSSGFLEVLGLSTSITGYLSVDSVRFSVTP